MTRNHCYMIAGIVATMSWQAAWAAAQPGMKTADEYYGRGVHAYFSGCAECAEHPLSMAMSLAPDDPRPYYFRALSRLRAGREFEARDDMQLGADLEAQSPGQFAVGKALQRVQGGHRLMLERYRQQARLAHRTTRSAVDAARQQQLQQRDDRVERRRVPVPLEMLTGDVAADDFAAETEPQPPQPIAPQRAEIRMPEAAEEGQPGAEQPAAPAEQEENPFRDDPFQGATVEEGPAADEPEATDDEADLNEFDENPFESLQ